MKLPGIPKDWASDEGIGFTAQNNWADNSMDRVDAIWAEQGDTTWYGPEPTDPEATPSSSDHPDLLTFQAIDRHLTCSESASRAATPTNWGEQTMADDTNTAAPAASGQHFPTIRAARTYINSTVARWTPPTAPSDASNIPTTPSAEYAYVHAAIHSVSIGLTHTPLGHHLRTASTTGDTNAARLLEARAWLLFDALKRLHDGGCVLRASMDFSDAFGSEFKDRELGFRARWVAVCRMLQRFGSAAEMVASGRGEEILEVYVAAPGAMGRKLEEDEKLANEGSEWAKPKLPPTLKRHPPSSDEQEAREEKKRKLNLESLPLEDVIEIMRDEKMKDRKAREAREDREAFFDLLLKNYV